MFYLWFIQQRFNKDTAFGLRKDKREEEAGEWGEEKKAETETNEGGKRGLSGSMKDRRRWTRGRKG